MRRLAPYKDYFWAFYDPLQTKEKEKVDYVLQIVISAQQIPTKFFKHVEDGIYEIRIDSRGDIYRIFSFFDEHKIVVLLHGFQKKTQKIQRKEINRAKQLRNNYYEDKNNK